MLLEGDGDIQGSLAGVLLQEVPCFQLDFLLVVAQAHQGGELREDEVDGVADPVVGLGLVVLAAGKEVVAELVDVLLAGTASVAAAIPERLTQLAEEGDTELSIGEAAVAIGP